MIDLAPRRDGRERGALLIDALVAISLFIAILGAWLSMTNSKQRAIGEAERRFRAVQAAESAIAELRDGAREPGAFKAAGGLDGEIETMPRADGTRDVTVTVRWMEPGRREESVRLSTVAAGAGTGAAPPPRGAQGDF